MKKFCLLITYMVCILPALAQNKEIEGFGKVADVVDLGLSVKWASWNVGASQVVDYGGLYGAGDPTGFKNSTNYQDYYWAEGANICGTQYDLAHLKWGNSWRLPTINELKELKEKCTWEHNIIINGVNGSVATGPNGNTLFFPYAGSRRGSSNNGFGKWASIWSGEEGYAGSVTYTRSYKDMDINLPTGTIRLDGCELHDGQSIRPVYDNTMTSETNYKSLDDYIANSELSFVDDEQQYYIHPIINNIKKVYIDLTKGSENILNCYLTIGNYDDPEETNVICFSSIYSQSTTNTNLHIQDRIYNIKDMANKETFSWLYYNPNNHNEIVIDVEEYYGKPGYIDRWQKNFNTSFIVNIETTTNRDELIAEDITGRVGSKVTLPIVMKNKESIKNLQFDLTLPAGVMVASDEDDELMFSLTDRADKSHALSSNRLSDGSYRVLITTLSNKAFKGNDGAVVEVTLDIPKDMKAGEYDIIISNIELNTTDDDAIRPETMQSKLVVKEILLGDVNGDESISVTDVGMMISYILQTNPAGFDKDAADVNGDGTISVTDVGALITKILTSDSSKVKTREYKRIFGIK